MDKLCPNCAQPVPENARFCPACGAAAAPLPEEEKQATAAPVREAPRAVSGADGQRGSSGAGKYIAAAAIVAAVLLAVLALRACEPQGAGADTQPTQQTESQQTVDPKPQGNESETGDAPGGKEQEEILEPPVAPQPPMEQAALWEALAGVWVNRDDPGGELLYVQFYTLDGVCRYASGVFGGDDEADGAVTAVRHVTGSTYQVDVHYDAVEKTKDTPARDAFDFTLTLDTARAAGEEILFAEDRYATTDYNQYEWAGASMETAKFSYFG